MTDNKKKTSFIFAVLPILIVIASLIYFVIIKGGAPHIAIIVAIAFTAAIGRWFLGYSWKEMLDGIVKADTVLISVFGILLAIGMLIGSWVISGTVPLLMVYGLKIISPGFFLPIVLVTASFISLATGTSWGTVGTMGLVFMGIGAGLGIPAHLTAAAVVSGAFFGDKMSPISDTTNFCSGLLGVNLFKHIGAMLPSTVPSMVIAFILFGVMGLGYGDQQIAAGASEEIITTLNATFKLNPFLLIPPVIVLVLAIKKFPPIPTLFAGILSAVILAFIIQGSSVEAVLGTVMYGYWSNTGIEVIDSLLSKGGLNSMLWILALMLLAVSFSGLLKTLKSIDIITGKVISVIKGIGGASVAAVANMLLMIYTADLYIGYTMTASVFGPIFRGKGYSSTNVSRILENSGTMMGALVPWGAAGVYIASMLDVSVIKYAPFALACYLPFLFDILWGFTGKFLPKATDEEKKDWIEQDQMIIKDGNLISASEFSVDQL
jgi:Na+:H+ antiporter, NhaC family